MRRWTGRGPRRGDNPLARVPGAVRPGLAGPGAARRPTTLFPDGWRRPADDAVAVGGVQPTLSTARPGGARAVRELAAERRTSPASCGSARRRATTARRPRARRTVSVGGMIEYARCPKRFYWSYVRPLPRFSGPAARIGTQVHAWIERQASGQASLLELDEVPDLTGEELAGEPGKVERLRQAFLESRFAGRRPALRGAAVPAAAGGVHGGRADRRRLRRSRRSVGGRRLQDGSQARGRRPARGCSSTCTRSRASRSGASGPKTSRSRTSISRAATRSRTPWRSPTR